MTGRKPTDEATRFWEKVDRRGEDQCWPWLAGTHKGYGTFRETGSPRGYKAQAQRVAYRLAGGTIPSGYDIDHLCHNRRCCNPKHLEAVSHSDNMRRMWAAGRGRTGAGSGALHPRARFTRKQVEAIKTDPRSSYAVAKELCTWPSQIARIRNGTIYREDRLKVYEHKSR